MTTIQSPDLTTLRGRQQKAWTSGDYGKVGTLRRALLLLVTIAVLTLAVSGVALAAKITCPNVGATYCTGTDNDDRLLGSAGPDNMSAGEGDDVLKGYDGDDNAMRGGPGEDRLYGGPGNDQLGGGPGKDVLEGGDGFDTYFFYETNWGEETIVDTPIVDTDLNTGHWVRFDSVKEDLIIDMNSRAEHEVRMRDGMPASTLDWENDLIDGVIDGKGDDSIIGRLAADNIQTFVHRGSDSVNARSGDDFIYTADDTVDTIECGDGFDTVRKDLEDNATNCESVTNL